MVLVVESNCLRATFNNCWATLEHSDKLLWAAWLSRRTSRAMPGAFILARCSNPEDVATSRHLAQSITLDTGM